MKIILVENVEKLGKIGDIAKVSDGYARNYLLPKRYAIVATANNLKKLSGIKEKAEQRRLEEENALKALAQKIEGTVLNFKRKADDNHHLYGSVSDVDIVKAMQESGFQIHKSIIKGDTHIKSIGNFDLSLHFAADIAANISVVVEKED